jgi:hypothetical protein
VADGISMPIKIEPGAPPWTLKEALRAAVFGAPLDIAPDQDLSWAKALVDAADGEVEAGATVDAKEAFAAVLQRIRES